jgi:hypothetical protein
VLQRQYGKPVAADDHGGRAERHPGAGGREDGSSGFSPVCPDAGSVWRQQFQYDRTGNRSLVQSNPPAPVGTPAAFSGANNRIADTGFAYDAIGNLTKFPAPASSSVTDRLRCGEPAGGVVHEHDERCGGLPERCGGWADAVRL